MSDLCLSGPLMYLALCYFQISTAQGVVGRSLTIGVSDRRLYSCQRPTLGLKLPIGASNVRVNEIWSTNFAIRPLQSLCIVHEPEFRCCDIVPKSDSKYHQLVVGRCINKRKTDGDGLCGSTSRTGPGIRLVWKGLFILCKKQDEMR